MSTLTETFSNIADAIRNKNGSSNTYTPAQMPAAINAIPTGGGSYQNKNVSPTESSQTITADSGYDALSSVTVGAVSSTYVGSGITRRSSSDLTDSGATVTVPAGYYSSQASKAITNGSVTAPSSISGSGATMSVNANTHSLTLTKSVNVTPNVTTAGYINAGTAGNSSVSLTASVNTISGQTITPTTGDIIVGGANSILTGNVLVEGDENLVAGNIKSGTSIFGVTGTYSGGGGGSTSLQWGVVRPDAELVQSYSYDKMIVEDEGVTIPAYNTSTKTLKASVTAGTVSLDFANYRYLVLQRMLTIPIYNTTDTAKGRTEWVSTSSLFEICSIDPNVCQALVDPTKKIPSRSTTCTNSWSLSRHCYWSGTSSLTLYISTAYGPYQAVQSPSFSTLSNTSGTLTLKSPIFYIRGNATYYTQTYWNATTDIRFQWKIDVYRVPVGTTDVEGWGLYSQFNHINDCIKSSTHTLT